MNTSTIELLREQVELLRERRENGEVSAAEAAELLVSSVDPTLDSHAQTEEQLHSGNVVHACPWHTCQATRHN